jgi:archaeosortase B (VPXXXP-CTERM-specific)
VIAFVALLLVLVLSVALAPATLVKPVADTTASVAGSLVAAAGVDNVVDANYIYLDKRTLLVGRDCTAAYLIAVYAALVLTYPSSRRDKLVAFAIGVPVLLAANMARLVGAGLVAEYLPRQFDVIHDYLFQVLLAIAVLFAWLAGIGRVKANET